MRMTAITEMVEPISGISKKTGNQFQGFKVHDEAAKEYVTIFVDEDVFARYKSIKSGAAVEIVLDVKLGSKYYSLVSMEPVEI